MFGDKGMVAICEALCAGGLKTTLVTLIFSIYILNIINIYIYIYTYIYICIYI